MKTTPHVNRLLIAGVATATVAGSGLAIAATARGSNGRAASTVGANASVQAAPKFQLPFSCGQSWRLDTWASDHNPALDMTREPNKPATEGSTVLAPAAGKVNQSFWHQNAGNVIQINHGGGHFTTYLHLKSRSVKAGQKVSLGTRIGYVGHTGPTSNGVPHLHYEQGYDYNHDGKVEWGYVTRERVKASFDGKTYTGAGKTWHKLKSKNKCAPKPPKKYYVKTKAKAGGYNTPTSKTRVGWLYAQKNYVFCTAKGRSVTWSKNKSSWWLKTDLDTGQVNKYVSAAYLGKGGAQPKDLNGKTIPLCK